MIKICVLGMSTLSIPALNMIIGTAQRANMGIATGVYADPPNQPPTPEGQVFKEWGIIFERGIVFSRAGADVITGPASED